MKKFDIIIIGAGHAGTEAATAAARILSRRSNAKADSASVALFTKSPDDIGALSCNPSIGGPGKSQLVAEIDALGGIMPRAADAAGIHFRVLNASHGPATRALRAQVDRDLYRDAVKLLIGSRESGAGSRKNAKIKDESFEFEYSNTIPAPAFAGVTNNQLPTPEIIYESVESLDLENKIINGKYSAKAIVITTGTFLNGLCHCGREKIESGRLQDDGTYQESDKNISKILSKAGFSLIRLKTGTPARLYADSIDFSKCEVQPGDENHPWFSVGAGLARPANSTDIKGGLTPPLQCYITRTAAETHQIIRDNITDAPMYNGDISGVGPRYCPSLEDKVMRFPEHETHHVFLEPETGSRKNPEIKIENLISESSNTTPDSRLPTPDLIYPNGLSTSMSAAVQDKFLRSIPGLENVRVARYGYAIEYDAIDARALKSTLESKDIPGLFFAGQICGTSGYEEAAAQGLVAGANAAAYAAGSRESGVGSRGPDSVNKKFKNTNTTPDSRLPTPVLSLDRTNSMIGVMIDDITTLGIDEPYRMFTSRAEYRLSLRADNAIFRLGPMAVELGLITPAEFDAKSSAKKTESENIDKMYAGYIARNMREIESYKKDRDIKIPGDFDYAALPGLTNELREKLTRTRPENIAALSRIPGITPAGVMIVLRAIKGIRHKAQGKGKTNMPYDLCPDSN